MFLDTLSQVTSILALKSYELRELGAHRLAEELEVLLDKVLLVFEGAEAAMMSEGEGQILADDEVSVELELYRLYAEYLQFQRDPSSVYREGFESPKAFADLIRSIDIPGKTTLPDKALIREAKKAHDRYLAFRAKLGRV